MPAGIPDWIPEERGSRHDLAEVTAEMPLVRSGGVHLVDTALWLPTHHHPRWELHYVHRGRIDFELHGEERVLTARGGWFVLTAPRRAHRARDGIIPPHQLVWLTLDPGHPEATRGTPFTRDDLRHLRAVLRRNADSVWPAPPTAGVVFRRLRDLCGEPPSPFTAAAKRAAVAELLILAASTAGPEPEPPALSRALAALAADPRRPCTVAAAATRAGISPARLHALCARHLGTTPAAWQLTQRLSLARERLAAGISVNTVADELGFSSPRYFAYAFRREVGVPPSRYAEVRALARKGPALRW